jgi:hypothetical protein
MQKLQSYNTARFFDCAANQENNIESNKNTKMRIFERILSNILSKNFSFDIERLKNFKIKRINSHKNFNFKNNKLISEKVINEIEVNRKQEMFSAAKINDYESIKIAKTSECRYIFEMKNNDKLHNKTKNTNEDNKTQDTKDICIKSRYSECISTINETGKLIKFLYLFKSII